MGLSLELATNPVEVSALKAANGRVWAGRSDGSLLMVNEATSKVEKTLSLAATTDPIEQLVLGSGAAYATAGSEREPHVFRIDTTSFKTQEASVISSTSLFSGFLYDGSVLWVLADNEFTLSKVDATTLSVLDSIPLGQNPSDPTGARVDKYGAGFMAQVGGKLWIIDSTTSQLLSVDKSTLVAKYVSDLKDLLEPSGSVIFTSNHDSLFLALADQGKIIRLDGQSGARVQTYTLETGAGRILTIGSDKLYLNSNNAGWDVSEIDHEKYRIEFAFPHPSAREVAFYDDDDGGKLVGVGLVDETPSALSAVYFFYDPARARDSLGVANVTNLLVDAKRIGIPHVYLGYRVSGCASLEYKGNYRPHELLVGRPGPNETPRWVAAPE
jgi:hypothetical protein